MLTMESAVETQNARMVLEPEVGVGHAGLPYPLCFPDVVLPRAVKHLVDEAERKGVKSLRNLPEEELAAIAGKVGGHPLMLELIVGLRDAELIDSTLETMPRELDEQLYHLLPVSLGRLGEEGRRLLPRLTVFSGTWDGSAAEAICAEHGLDLDRGIEQLLQGSLLRLRDDRYSMHEWVRHYALMEMPLDVGSRQFMRCTHAQYYLKLAEDLSTRLHGGQIWKARNGMERELPNLRAAMAWARRQDDELGWRLVRGLGLALFTFFELTGMRREWEDWGKAALQACERLNDSSGAAQAHNTLGLLYAYQGNWRQAVEHYRKALDIMQDLEAALPAGPPGTRSDSLVGKHRRSALAMAATLSASA